MNKKNHPLYYYSEEEKVDYLMIIASVSSADGEVSDEEILKLREICKSVELSSKSIGNVIAAAEGLSDSELTEILDRLKKSDLKFTLLSDMIFLAYVDDDYDEYENQYIEGIAKQLKIKKDQLEAIKKYVNAVRKAQNSKDTKESLKELGGDVAASLATTGVPIAAVAVSGSVFGLSATGITSGLAALGMGLGMTTGIGVVAALGAGSYFGVRWLYKKATGA